MKLFIASNEIEKMAMILAQFPGDVNILSRSIYSNQHYILKAWSSSSPVNSLTSLSIYQ